MQQGLLSLLGTDKEAKRKKLQRKESFTAPRILDQQDNPAAGPVAGSAQESTCNKFFIICTSNIFFVKCGHRWRKLQVTARSRQRARDMWLLLALGPRQLGRLTLKPGTPHISASRDT
eukprot:1160997-Pelagomonas_calceolata.AAC.10